MEKEHKLFQISPMASIPTLLAVILVFASILIAISPYLASAQDASDIIQSQTGINPNAIPQSPQEVGDYLSQEWGTFIAKTPLIGTIHTFFTNNPLIFQIIFGEPYAISATFIFVFILWLFVFINASRLFESSGLIKQEGYSWLAGAGAAIIIAQINVYHYIGNGISTFAFSQEAWWARTLVFAIAVVVIVALSYMLTLLDKYMIFRKGRKQAQVLKQRSEESKEFTKGIEETKNIVKDWT